MSTQTKTSQRPIRPASRSGFTLEAQAPIVCERCGWKLPIGIEIEITASKKAEDSILEALRSALGRKGWELRDNDPDRLVGLCPLCRFASDGKGDA